MIQSGQTLWCEGLRKKYQLWTSTTKEKIIKKLPLIYLNTLWMRHTSPHLRKIEKKGIPFLCYKVFLNYFTEHSSLALNTQTQLPHEQTPTVPGQAACLDVHGRSEYLLTQGGPLEHRMKTLSSLWKLERDKLDAKLVFQQLITPWLIKEWQREAGGLVQIVRQTFVFGYCFGRLTVFTCSQR